MSTTYRIVLPSIYPPYTQRCLARMHPDLLDNLTIIDNTTVNRGVAASWNAVAKTVLANEQDWLVILSAATRFGDRNGLDFIDHLDRLNGSAWVVESSMPVGWHLLGWSRDLLETVGIFDENFFAYGEDADMSRRVHVAQSEGLGGTWERVVVDAWIASQNHGMKLGGAVTDQRAQWRYYVSKHGGLSGHEVFARPFDDPSNPLSYWPKPKVRA